MSWMAFPGARPVSAANCWSSVCSLSEISGASESKDSMIRGLYCVFNTLHEVIPMALYPPIVVNYIIPEKVAFCACYFAAASSTVFGLRASNNLIQCCYRRFMLLAGD